MGAFTDVAPALYGFGLNMVPVEGKRAVVPWKHLQTERQTEAELGDLLRRHSTADPAVVLGPASGLVDLDVDDPAAAEEAIRRAGLLLPPTSCFDSRRGPHRLYRSAEDLPKRPSLLPGLDFLGRGAIVVVPPAAERRWLVGLEYLTDLPVSWIDFVRDRSRRDAGSAHPPLPASALWGKPAPHLQSSEYSLLGRSSLLGGPECLEELFSRLDVVQRVCELLGIPAVDVSRPFCCVLPGHGEARASASLYRDGVGRFVYHDWHRRDGREFFTLSAVYAAQVSGAVRALGGSERAMWMIRLLHAVGVLELPQISTPVLPAAAADTIRRALEGFVLLKRCRYPHDGDAPAPYTRGFASAWVGISDWQAGEAIRRLIDAGSLRRVGSYRGLRLYALGRQKVVP
jgi:hypothetical protein